MTGTLPASTDKALDTLLAMKRARGPAKGWLPNQHGAWAMLVLPWVFGFTHALATVGLRVEHLLLFAFWMVSYFAFFVAGLWLKSRFKPRYVPALVTYGGAAAVLGLALALLAPHWLPWVLVFAPVCGFALWLAWRRQERDVVSGLATVVAACLIPLVMGGLAAVPLALALVCLGYFFGTVWYVKTVIRQRGKPGWVVASVAWHAACAVAVWWVPEPLPAAWLGVFFAALCLRALLVPLLGPMSGRRVDVKVLGIWEFVTSAALLGIMLPALMA